MKDKPKLGGKERRMDGMFQGAEIEIAALKSDYPAQPIQATSKPLAKRLETEIKIALLYPDPEGKRNQLFRVYGRIQMAHELHAIIKAEYGYLCCQVHMGLRAVSLSRAEEKGSVMEPEGKVEDECG